MAEVNYQIYQFVLRNTSPEKMVKKAFSSLHDSVQVVDIDYEGYHKTYSGTIECSESPIETLEAIFTKFNIDRPFDFEGHSLSVSDIVQLGDEFYHCQSSGWKKISVRKTNVDAERELKII